MKTKRIFLIFILLLGFFLRVYKVAEYPAGLNADEAAIGYNAYSLLQTGKDEFGHPWPINFQSFNDFKPGLYFYLVLPFVKLFGLTELAVRLPSAILGSLTVLILYFLVKKIISADFAVLAAFLLSVSPWHLHFSRGGWESNTAVFFILLGVYLFYRSLEKPKYFIFCAVCFVFSMYTYHSARLITPLLLLGLAVFYKREIFLKRNAKSLIFAIVVAFLVSIPLALGFLGGAGTSRFSGVGIFADQGPFWRVNELRGQHENPFGIMPKIFHNKVVEYGLLFFDNLLRHYSGDFLFISGDEIQRNKIPEMGQMYLLEIPFLILGIYFFLKNRPKNWQFIVYWLAIAPFASSLTFQSPHAIRSLNMVIPLVIITGYGISNLLILVKKIAFKKVALIVYGLLLIAYCWNIAFYLHQYYVHYPQVYPAAWEYGFKDLTGYLKEKQNNFDRIYVTNRYDQPYILLAFYLKYPPADFQREAKLTEIDIFGFSTVDHFSRYYFGPVDQNKLKEPNCLIIGAPGEIPDSATISKRIYFKDGKTEAFRIVEN